MNILREKKAKLGTVSRSTVDAVLCIALGERLCRMSWKIYFFFLLMALLFLIRCDSICFLTVVFFCFPRLLFLWWRWVRNVWKWQCVCVWVSEREWVTIVSFSSMITAFMTVDLSSTCLFTFCVNAHSNSRTHE